MQIEKDANHRSIGKEIGILSRSAHVFLQHQFNEYDIGHAQVMTLHFICRHDGLTQNELGRFFNLDKSSITSQLNKLEKNGYIIREINREDSRGRRLYITPKTKSIEADLYLKFSAWSNVLLQGFDEAEQEQLFNFLDQMKANAQRAINEVKSDEEKK